MKKTISNDLSLKSAKESGFEIGNLHNQLVESRYRSSTDVSKTCQFGLEALDDGLVHIFSDDLILIGAPTGSGKSQLCAHFMIENAKAGKKVYYVALESAKNEVKDRILYSQYAKHYFGDKFRKESKYHVNYLNWSAKRLDDIFEKYAIDVEEGFQGFTENIQIINRKTHFNINSLKELMRIAMLDEPNLIIIDHAHYFDYDTINDNRALKEIMMACRDITQVQGVPIILVAHLRKRDKKEQEPVPSLEEFHGSSDLTKIATRVITMSQGRLYNSRVQTYFRVSKDRRGSQLTRYIVVCQYNLDLQKYSRPDYVIGKFIDEKGVKVFQPCSDDERPKWAIHAKPMRSDLITHTPT